MENTVGQEGFACFVYVSVTSSIDRRSLFMLLERAYLAPKEIL
jgi:hypothetical protein